jgi:hypothetical protein
MKSWILNFIKKYGYIVYPLLFAIFPLVSFYGANASEVLAGDFDITPFLIFNLSVVVLLWLVSLAVTKNRHKASLLALVLLAIFFSFGRVHDQLQGIAIKTPIIALGPTKILLIASIFIIGIVWLWIRRISNETVEKLSPTMTLAGVAIVITSVIPIFTAYASSSHDSSLLNSAPKELSVNNAEAPTMRPDVYYILLDSYARQDFLKENFDYDNSAFIDGLRNRGFYVADKANSNYAHTHFSVPSTFNMKYLNYLTEELGEESTDRLPLKYLTQNNSVVPIFRSFGYKYINIGSKWGWSLKSPYSDIDISASDSADSKILNIDLDEFALVYLQTTVLKPWISTNIRGDFLAQILGAFDRTKQVPIIEDPTFTFTHVLSPHPPYLFDRNGVIPGQTELELLNDGYSDREAFADQTDYVNHLTLELIDTILKDSQTPPIIILASDHGPASDLGRSDFMETDPSKFNSEGIRERFGILNSYYFPDGNYNKLYPSISPVNSIRLILEQYFGQDLELLPDLSYFSDNKANEYRMFEVSDLLR